MADELYICPRCRCAYAGPACENPGCEANPSIPEETKARWRRAAEAQEASRKDLAARLAGHALSFKVD